MSETLVIRDLRDSTVERLRIRASMKHRTMEQEALAILEKELPDVENFDRAAHAAAIRAMGPSGVQGTDSLVLLREDRARDDADE